MSNNGTYEEKLPCGGELNVSKSSWYIQYYFPGPDLRYNGTFVRIPSSEIDDYITGLKENWDKYCEIKKTIPKGGEFNAEGECRMQIHVGGYWEGVCIRSYHMPLKILKSINRVIDSYEYAKKGRAKSKKSCLNRLRFGILEIDKLKTKPNPNILLSSLRLEYIIYFG